MLISLNPENLLLKNYNEVSKSKEISLIHRCTVCAFKYRIAEVITFQYLHWLYLLLSVEEK